MNNYHAGHLAEKAVLWFLRLKGYRLVAANYVTGRGTRAGEVDLIMKRFKTLVFIEVKKRPSAAAGKEAVMAGQQRRIRRAAEAFVARYPAYGEYNLRFDVAVFTPPCRIRHFENMF